MKKLIEALRTVHAELLGLEKCYCKGDGYSPACEYDGVWFCKHPNCSGPVITSSMYGECPAECPKHGWRNRNEQ